MSIQIGKKVLLTTNDWFRAPDGNSYKAVYGTIKAVLSDNEFLGIKTNRHSTNWYVEIGNMTVAGCQVFYAVETDKCSFGTYTNWNVGEKETNITDNIPCAIYNADVED